MLHVSVEHPDHNQIEIPERVLSAGHGLIEVVGYNNRIKIDEPSFLHTLNIVVGGDAKLTIGRNCVIHDASFAVGAGGGIIKIGAGTVFGKRFRALVAKGVSITVGNGCCFEDDVQISSARGKTVFNVLSEEVLNPASNISLGDRVLVNNRSCIWAGAAIGANSIIDWDTHVAAGFPAHSLISGNPAALVQAGMDWRY